MHLSALQFVPYSTRFLKDRKLLSLLRNVVLGHMVGQVHCLNSHRKPV